MQDIEIQSTRSVSFCWARRSLYYLNTHKTITRNYSSFGSSSIIYFVFYFDFFNKSILLKSLRPLWAIKKISLESPRLAWFNDLESQKFELECKTSRIYLAFYFILFAIIHNFRTFQATLEDKNDITRKLWINSILWCTNKKNWAGMQGLLAPFCVFRSRSEIEIAFQPLECRSK